MSRAQPLLARAVRVAPKDRAVQRPAAPLRVAPARVPSVAPRPAVVPEVAGLVVSEPLAELGPIAARVPPAEVGPAASVAAAQTMGPAELAAGQLARVELAEQPAGAVQVAQAEAEA